MLGPDGRIPSHITRSKPITDLFNGLKKPSCYHRCVAVGEIGLDYHRDTSPRDVQQRVLEKLVNAAVRAKKPLILHCRESGPGITEAQRDLLAVLESVGSLSRPAGVAHCFQGSEEPPTCRSNVGICLGLTLRSPIPRLDTSRSPGDPSPRVSCARNRQPLPLPPKPIEANAMSLPISP